MWAGSNWLGYSVGIEIDLLFVRGSKFTSFLCAGRNYLVPMYGSKLTHSYCGSKLARSVSKHRYRLDIRVGIKVDLISVMGSNWLGFCGRDRNWLGFSVGIEIDLFFVRGSNLTSFLCAGRTYLVVMCAWKYAWFLCAGRKWLVFSEGIDSLGFCVGRKWLGFSYEGRKSLGLIVSFEIDLVFVWVVEVDLISQYGDGTWLHWFGCCVGGR